MSSRYEKEKIIGSGTFGNVWLVKSKLSRHAYVLKEINLKSLNESGRQQAQTEVAVLSKCKHKHIIRYKEAAIEWNETLSLVMEYAEGGDLSTAIQKQDGVPFGDHRVLTWFIQICLAMQYIHHQNILHRDLKSQNIFLTRNKTIKVGDFGIARVLQHPEELARTAIGTPYYLSPEIYQRKPYNHKSDIWSLGCILFEMAALERAFKADDFIHLASLILKGKRQELPRYCGVIIRDLVEDLLHLDPENRPSAADILADPLLQSYLSEYMLSHTSPKNSPDVSGLKQTSARKVKASETFESLRESCLKRRASVTATNPKGSKQRTTALNEDVQTPSKPYSNFRAFLTRKYRTTSPQTKVQKPKDIKNLTYVVTNPKFPCRFIKKMASSLTSSCDEYSISESYSTRPSSKLTKSEDAVLNEIDCGYQSEEIHLGSSGNPSNENWCPLFRSTKNSPALLNETARTDKDKVARDTPSNDTEQITTNTTHHNPCNHSQCYQCMLNMLWKNRIRCCVEASVNTDEYTRLRNKLFLLYEEELFQKVYQSLTCECGGKDPTSKNVFLNMMHLLNYEQMQSLPLMMQLVQLDLLMKSKQND